MEKHKKIDTKAIEYHIAGILKALGDDPEREGLKDTPKRVAKMYEEVFDGMNYTNEEIADMFNKTFALDMDEEAIDSMLSTLSSLTAIEEISDYTDLKEFGFDQPEDLISYTTSEGSVSLFVGNKNDTLNAYYIISADGGSIYLTETSLADAFSKTIEELTVTEDTESTETVENTETVSENTEE